MKLTEERCCKLIIRPCTHDKFAHNEKRSTLIEPHSTRRARNREKSLRASRGSRERERKRDVGFRRNVRLTLLPINRDPTIDVSSRKERTYALTSEIFMRHRLLYGPCCLLKYVSKIRPAAVFSPLIARRQRQLLGPNLAGSRQLRVLIRSVLFSRAKLHFLPSK